MKKSKTLEEFREYHKRKTREAYLRLKADPIRWEQYKIQRRIREKKYRLAKLEQLKASSQGQSPS